MIAGSANMYKNLLCQSSLKKPLPFDDMSFDDTSAFAVANLAIKVLLSCAKTLNKQLPLYLKPGVVVCINHNI